MDKKQFVIGFLLIVAGVLIGSGVGQLISELTGKSVSAPSTIGLGIGLLAAVVYIIMQKK